MDSDRRRHPKEWLVSEGIESFAKHLAKDYDIYIQFSTQTAQTLDILRFSKLKQQALNQLKARLSNVELDLNGRALRAHFLSWIVADNLPQSIAKSPCFRSVLHYMSPEVNELLSRFPATVR